MPPNTICTGHASDDEARPAPATPTTNAEDTTPRCGCSTKYSALGGLVQVTTAQVSPGWVSLIVGNGGEVLTADQVELLFEPFQRGRRTRTGSADPAAVAGAGLGLSIVRAVTTAHGGRATATARPGGGLTLSLLLPASG
ncbi:ATP-binding protein [Streptacidiphilus sp. PAMC 29251]